MRAFKLYLLMLATAGLAAAQEPTPPPITCVVPVAAPDEVLVFADRTYRGEWMRLKVGDELPNLKETPGGNWELRISSLKVGDEAVAVLYSSFDFHRSCLGLPGKGLGGSGYYPDLAKVQSNDLRRPLDDGTRSLRVLGKGVELAKVCLPFKPKAKSKMPLR